MILLLTPMQSEYDKFAESISYYQMQDRVCLRQLAVGKVEAAVVAMDILQNMDREPIEFVCIAGFAAGSGRLQQGDIVFPSVTQNGFVTFPQDPIFAPFYKKYPLLGRDEVLSFTSDRFVTAQDLEEIQFHEEAVFDMEATSVARVCEHFGKQLLLAKVISDNPQHPNNFSSFSDFVASYPNFHDLLQGIVSYAGERK